MVRNFLTAVAAGLLLATVATVLAPSQALAGPPVGPHYLPVYGYHHHYYPHYGYGRIYVGPAVVFPAAPIVVGPVVAPDHRLLNPAHALLHRSRRPNACLRHLRANGLQQWRHATRRPGASSRLANRRRRHELGGCSATRSRQLIGNNLIGSLNDNFDRQPEHVMI